MVKVQWYPGHMEKARRQMKEALNAVDVIIELRDARIPLASANPILETFASNKPHLIVLSKKDLADDGETEKWIRRLTVDNQKAIALDLQRDPKSSQKVLKAVLELAKEKREKQMARGIKPRPVRAMACGIPNVGKSTMINRMAGKNTVKTADKPGVTRSLSWIHADPQVDLLDTPGVLWPKFEDEKTGSLLAAIGSINDDILDLSMIAMDAIHIIDDRYPSLFHEVYGAEVGAKPPAVLRAVGEARNLRGGKGEVDKKRAAILFLQELRKGKLGKLTLEGADEAIEETVSE